MLLRIGQVSVWRAAPCLLARLLLLPPQWRSGQQQAVAQQGHGSAQTTALHASLLVVSLLVTLWACWLVLLPLLLPKWG